MAFLLEKLEVYNKAVNFAEQVIKETRSFPKGLARVGKTKSSA